MRKLLSIAFIFLLLLTLPACGKEPAANPQQPESVPDATAPAEDFDSKDPASTAVFFSQDWYGWWSIQNGTGIYRADNMLGNWWDACLRIQLKDGVGSLTFYDQESSQKEPLAKLQASILTDGPAVGCLVAGEGSFLNMDAPKGYWLISPKGSLYENVLRINGRYDDPEHPGSSFEYTIVLKPWGSDWENVPTTERPYLYDHWYLPLIQGGKAMPDTIG